LTKKYTHDLQIFTNVIYVHYTLLLLAGFQHFRKFLLDKLNAQFKQKYIDFHCGEDLSSSA